MYNNRTMKFIVVLFTLFCVFSNLFADAKADISANKVFVVKIDGMISSPQVSIIKRAVREANEAQAKHLIIDLDTPGGDLQSTLEIMDALRNFKGKSACYVNPEAISAGSFIASSCDKIFFAPQGVIGAAEAVSATGGNIDASMQRKLTSYLSAKVRSLNEKDERRSDVQRAMNDPDFELKLGGKIIKRKGELLSLTAKEACEKFEGRPLLGDGIFDSLSSLAENLAGKSVTIENVHITWADQVSKYIATISPLLIGGGLLLLFMELKSGGFGVLGGIGIGLLLLAFIGARLSGIAGYEPILFFLLGLVLIALELFLLQGFIVPAITGFILIVGALVWAFSDIWPERGFDYNMANIYMGILNVGIGILIAFVGALLLGKYMPSNPLFKRLILKATDTAKKLPDADGESLIGSVGECVSDLTPSGRIRVAGKLLEAQALFGTLSKGDKVKIISKKDFNFLVKRVD